LDRSQDEKPSLQSREFCDCAAADGYKKPMPSNNAKQ
jgi:hypothetical protein